MFNKKKIKANPISAPGGTNMRSMFVLLSLFRVGYVHAQNNISIAVTKGKDTINRSIYGHFAEHLGRCIYDGLYVGEKNKLIPNKDGIRLDIVEALKKLKVPVLRWPGGCFAQSCRIIIVLKNLQPLPRNCLQGQNWRVMNWL